jgi:carbon monoxide dehydrogenase subunit G
MEHEVFVPFPPGAVEEALRDPARVTRALHGFQADPVDKVDAPPNTVTGRLRFRVGGSTITYRGTLSLTERDSGLLAEVQAAEARGSGRVKIAIEAVAVPAEGGTRLTFTGRVRRSGGGRLAGQDAAAVASAARRLLDRFAAEVTTAGPAAGRPDVTDDGAGRAQPWAEAETGATANANVGATADADAEATADVDAEATAETEALRAASETEALQPGAEAGPGPEAEDGGGPGASAELAEGVTVPESAAELDPLPEDLTEDSGEPPAEAAHARRTMIGRSAEEVDHAPPRGRYAPVPPPEPNSGRVALRWAAPAAAALLASAVVVGRVLRRRR